MGIEDVRQENLRKLKSKYGTIAALSEIIDVVPNYISRVLSSGPNRKRLKEDLARKIEKKAGLPPLWLDQSENATVESPPPWPFPFSRARFERLDAADREKIGEAMGIMVSLCERSRLDRATKKRAA